MLTNDEVIDRLLDLAFAEDIGDGDATTLCCIPSEAEGKQKVLIKEDGILAGVKIAERVFHKFDPTLQVETLIEDGTPVRAGDVAMIVSGKVRSLLQTERLMLNIMQRMSGIATTTHIYQQKLTCQGARYAQDHSRHASARENGSKDRRRRQSQNGPV